MSEIVAQSHGLLDRLKLMHNPNKQLRFQNTTPTMTEEQAGRQEDVSVMPTNLFLPDGEFRDGGFAATHTDDSAATPFSPSDLPPYTASPDDTMMGTRPLTKRENLENLTRKKKATHPILIPRRSSSSQAKKEYHPSLR